MNFLNNKTENNLDKVVKKLEEGKIVVYPTDTIYGIAANINNIMAVKKVYSIKDRPFTKPLSVCFHDFEQLQEYVYLNTHLIEIIKQLLPGPYTLLLHKKNKINPLITANSNIVGIRIPNNTISYKLTKKFPITSTSANISNQKTPNNVPEIKKQLKNNIDYYIDNGEMTNNKASTIIDLTKNKPTILRKGVYDEKIINEILKINL